MSRIKKPEVTLKDKWIAFEKLRAKNNFKDEEFILCEIMRVDLDKWLDGCKKNEDPGNDYVLDWVTKNAAKYREQWESSKCYSCSKWHDCGWKALSECQDYDEE